MFVGVSTALTAVRRVFHPFIKEGLKLYYRFINNTPDFLLDGSTSFDGTDDYIDLDAHIGDFSSQTTGTISLWFKTSSDSASMSFISASDWGDASSNFSILCNVKKIQLNIRENGTYTIDAVGSVDYNDNKWHHLAFAVDGSGNKMYIDGSQIALTYSTGSASTQSWFNSINDLDTLSIGANKDNTTRVENYFNGSIANVGIWDRALSASEIESIYWRGSYSELKDTELTNLVSWYNLSSTGLGAEVISNGTMETVSTNTLLPNYESFPEDWTSNYGTLSVQERSSAQAFSGTHSLRFKTNASSRSGVVQTLSVTGSASYRLEFYVYGVTGSTIQITHQTGSGTASTLDGGGTLLDYEQSVTIGEWKQITFDFTTTGSGTVTGTVLQLGSNVSGNEYYIDNVSLKRIGAGAPDSQGNNDGTIEGATTNSDSYSGESPFKPRIQDKAHPKMAVQLADGSTSFDGVNDYFDTGSTFESTFNSSFTISGWYKLDDGQPSTTEVLFGAFSGISGVQLYQTTAGKLHGNYNAGSNTTEFESNDVLFTNGQQDWHHIVYQVDSATNQMYLYVDGSAITLASDPNDGDLTGVTMSDFSNSSYNLVVGARNVDGSISLEGAMDISNFSIHSATLTQTQIQELMFTEKYSGLSADLKTNLVSWYDLGSTTLGSEMVTNGDFSDGSTGWTLGSFSIVNGQATITDASATDYSLDSDTITGFDTSKRYQLSYDCIANTAGIQSGVYIRNADLSPTGTFLKHTDTGTKTLIFTPTATSHRIRLYHDGGGAGDTTTIDNVSIKEITLDDSEGTNHGSPVGTTTNTGYTHSPHGVVDPLNFGEVYSGRALDFDGTNDFASMSFSESGNYTISAWFKINTSQTGGIVDWGDQATGERRSMILWNGGSGLYKLWSSTYGSNIAGGTFLSTGIWYHGAITVNVSDGSTIIYLNGSQDGSGTHTINSFTGTTGYIGKTGSNEFFDGEINNVKVFNTALTQDQVRELYTKPETVLPTGVSASNLKLDLPMQEGSGNYIYDGSGNQNHGLVAGASWVTGEEYGYQASLVRSNTPMIFDDSDDFVTLSDSSALTFGTNDFTLSTWIYVNDLDNDLGVVGGETNSFGMAIKTSGALRATKVNIVGESDSTSTVSVNTWHHIAYTRDYSTSTGTYYIDGVASGTTVDNNDYTVVSKYIGRAGASTVLFDGIINEVAYWDVALDADAVSALYGSGVPLLPTSDSGNYDNSDSLVGYWRNDSNSTWTDRANTGVASFDGTDDYIETSDAFNYTNHTFAGWVKVNDTATNKTIMQNQDTGLDGVYIYSRTSESIRYSLNDSNLTSSSAYIDVWTHIACTYDGTTQKLYINGSLDQSVETTQVISVSGNMVIGARSFGAKANFFNGQMANVNVFNTALSATEVSELYAIDKRSSISGHSQFSNCVASYLMGAGDGDTASTIQDQTSNNNDGTVNGASIIGYNDGTASGSPVSIVIPEGSTEGRDNQGYYLSDTTAISNGIRLFGSEYIDVQDSEALSFGDGTDDRPFSIETWVKIPDATVFTPLVYKYESGKLEYRFVSYSGGVIINTYDNSATAYIGRRYATALTAYNNQWVHLVGTYSGNGANNGFKIYLNGSQIDDTDFGSGSYVAMENLLSNVEIGRDHSTTYSSSFHDEVRIYSKELSADEVTKNYNNGKSSHQ